MPGEQAFKHEEKPKFYSKKTKYIFFQTVHYIVIAQLNYFAIKLARSKITQI